MLFLLFSLWHFNCKFNNNNMTEYSLSICIPSKRNLEESRASISSAIGFCDITGSELVVSDSSGEKNKSEMWNNIPLPFMNYLKNENKKESKWSDNWYNGIQNCSGNFIGVVSDDDIIVNLEKSVVDYKEISQTDLAGIKPIISLWNSKQGIYELNNFNINGNTAIERIKQYHDLSAGNNTTYYSFFKKEILNDIYKLLTYHPTKGGYLDWPIARACVASGKVLTDETKLLVYKNNNWFGDQEFINKQAMKLYEDCDLGVIGCYMSDLFHALDTFILIMRKKSNVPFDEKLEAAEYALDFHLNRLIDNYNRGPHFFKQVANEIEKINIEENIALKLKNALNILKVQFPNLVNDYLLFYEKSTESKWGDID